MLKHLGLVLRVTEASGPSEQIERGRHAVLDVGRSDWEVPGVRCGGRGGDVRGMCWRAGGRSYGCWRLIWPRGWEEGEASLGGH